MAASPAAETVCAANRRNRLTSKTGRLALNEWLQRVAIVVLERQTRLEL